MILHNPPFPAALAGPNRIGRSWHQWLNHAMEIWTDLVYKSYCFVHKNANDQAITAGAEALLTWTTAAYDTQSEVDLTNEKWTCKKAGVYYVYCRAAFAVGADGDRLYLNIYKSNTKIAEFRTTAGGGGDESLESIALLYLEVDDYITFKVENTDNNDTIRGAVVDTFFTIYRLGW